MNNADKIRQMSDEELAKKIIGCAYCENRSTLSGCSYDCTNGHLAWLQKEAPNE